MDANLELCWSPTIIKHRLVYHEFLKPGTGWSDGYSHGWSWRLQRCRSSGAGLTTTGVISVLFGVIVTLHMIPVFVCCRLRNTTSICSLRFVASCERTAKERNVSCYSASGYLFLPAITSDSVIPLAEKKHVMSFIYQLRSIKLQLHQWVGASWMVNVVICTQPQTLENVVLQSTYTGEKKKIGVWVCQL